MITDRTAWLVSFAGGACAYGYMLAHALCQAITLEQWIGIGALIVGSLFLLTTAVLAALSLWWPNTFQPRLWIGNPYGGGRMMSVGEVLLLAPVLFGVFVFCLYASVSSWCFGHEIVPIRSRSATTVLTSEGPANLLATLTPSRTAP